MGNPRVWETGSEERRRKPAGRKANEDERAEARAAPLSLHTLTHLHVSEGLAGDLRRSPRIGAWPLAVFRSRATADASSTRCPPHLHPKLAVQVNAGSLRWIVGHLSLRLTLEGSSRRGRSLWEVLKDVDASDRALRTFGEFTVHRPRGSIVLVRSLVRWHRAMVDLSNVEHFWTVSEDEILWAVVSETRPRDHRRRRWIKADEILFWT